uniref:GG21154 n=1 Tax=Drosophila erecta TaxID=7220 RepID=B3P3M2_DROER
MFCFVQVPSFGEKCRYPGYIDRSLIPIEHEQQDQRSRHAPPRPAKSLQELRHVPPGSARDSAWSLHIQNCARDPGEAPAWSRHVPPEIPPGHGDFTEASFFNLAQVSAHQHQVPANGINFSLQRTKGNAKYWPKMCVDSAAASLAESIQQWSAVRQLCLPAPGSSAFTPAGAACLIADDHPTLGFRASVLLLSYNCSNALCTGK